MLDSIGISFPSPFTPSQNTPKQPDQKFELTVKSEPQSMLDFLNGTPKRTPQKSEYDKQQEVKTGKLKELIHKKRLTTKDKLQLNDLREEFSGVPNPNKEIAANAIKKAIKDKITQKKAKNEMLVNASARNETKKAATTIQNALRGHQARKETEDRRKAKQFVNTTPSKSDEVKITEASQLFQDKVLPRIKRRMAQKRVLKNASQEIRDIESKPNTRASKDEKISRIGIIKKGTQIIQNKMAVRPVGRPPRKSNAMSELEKQVSGHLLSA
jgi:hypothetical protein